MTTHAESMVDFARKAGMKATTAGRTGSVKDLSAAILDVCFVLESLGIVHKQEDELLVEIRDLLKNRR